MIEPDKKVVAWKKEPAIERLARCKGMLYVHGFITEAENRRIQERMIRWAVKHRKIDRSGAAGEE